MFLPNVKKYCQVALIAVFLPLAGCASSWVGYIDLSNKPIASKVINRHFLTKDASFAYTDRWQSSSKNKSVLLKEFDYVYVNRCLVRDRASSEKEVTVKECRVDIPVLNVFLCPCNEYDIVENIRPDTEVIISSVMRTPNKPLKIYKVYVDIPIFNLKNVEIPSRWYDLNWGDPMTIDLDYMSPVIDE